MDQRILSIQSHVAYGYVGGKAAVFPLQCLGYDVDVVNTVNYSNHAGYPTLGGPKSSATDIQQVFDRLRDNELLHPTRLLTGYIPGAAQATVIRELAASLKLSNPDLIYLFDPVMGDAGRLYVSPDIVPIYRTMLPLATIITPNWFEVELLTETPLTSPSTLQQALIKLHTHYHVPNIVITSIPLTPWLLDILPSEIRPPTQTTPDPNFLLCLSSTHNPAGNPSHAHVHATTIPLIPGYFSGVGDLFSALLLAHYSSSSSLPIAASLALSKTYAILHRTHSHSMASHTNSDAKATTTTNNHIDSQYPIHKSRIMKSRELRLIQSMDIIIAPDSSSDSPFEMRNLLPWSTFWQ